jgi:hypothetical protein
MTGYASQEFKDVVGKVRGRDEVLAEAAQRFGSYLEGYRNKLSSDEKVALAVMFQALEQYRPQPKKVVPDEFSVNGREFHRQVSKALRCLEAKIDAIAAKVDK